jgi:glutaredoxin 2
MTQFARSLLYASLFVLCFAIGSEAQPPSSSAPNRESAPVDGNIVPIQRWPNGVPMYQTDLDAEEPRAIQLAKQVVSAKTNAEKEKLMTDLKDTLNKQFEDRQKHHEKEIEALEEKLKKIKELVAKRQENKKEIIEEKTKQLEREARGRGW